MGQAFIRLSNGSLGTFVDDARPNVATLVG